MISSTSSRGSKSRKKDKDSLDSSTSGAQRRYLALCTKKNLKPEETLFRSLQHHNFKSNLDNLDPEEMEIILELMAKFSTMEKIQVALGKVHITRDMKSKLERLGFTEPIACTQQGSVKLCKGIATMMFKSSKLVELNLDGLKILPQSYKVMAKGLNNAGSLTSINLSSTGLGDAGLAALAGAFSHRPHLLHLSLSNCDLTDKCYRELGQIIRVHGVRRDEKCWTTSLRGRIPKVSSDGLQLLDISNNKLGDQVVETLCESLVHDKWMIGINLNSNDIGPKSIVHLVELLRTNTSFLVLTLKNSSKADPRLVQFVENLLLKRSNGIAEAVSLTSNEAECALMCEVLSNWGVPSNVLPRMNGGEIDPEVEGKFDNLSNSFVKLLKETTTDMEPPSRPELSLSDLPPAPTVSKKKKGKKKTATKAAAAPAPPSAQWAADLMERMRMMTEAQHKANAQIQLLKDENHHLRSELNSYKFSSSTSPKTNENVITPSEKSRAEHEDSIMLQLESSIVNLAEKVQHLEASKKKPKSSSKSSSPSKKA